MTLDRESVAGRLLVSTDPHDESVFGSAVVLMLMDSDEGAHGLVLNQPLDVPVERVLEAWQEHVTAPHVLFQGGPVGLDTAMGLVGMPGNQESEQLGLRLLFGSVGVVDLDAPPELIVPEVSGLRVFVGYSGWDTGQLGEELDRGDWYVVDMEPRDPFSDDPEGLWEQVLRRQRNQLSYLITKPADAEWN